MSALNHLLSMDASIIDDLARRQLEAGRDWRVPAKLRIAMPERRTAKRHVAVRHPKPACRIVSGCGYHFCTVCGGNDFQDTPFTCGEVA